jgi:predicted DNA-binding protein
MAGRPEQLHLVQTVKSTFRIPKALHQRLKLRAVQEDRQMADLIVDAVEFYLSRRGDTDESTLRS